MTTRATGPITEETVRALSKQYEEPQWLLDRRLEALRAYESMTMPNPLAEEWRRTDISGLDIDATLRVVSSLGSESIANLPELDLPSGTVFTDIQTAMREHPSLVQKYLHSLVKPTEWKLQALAAALRQGGIFLYVPKGVEVELPLDFMVSSSGAACFPHLVIVADENSSVTVVQETSSPDDARQALVSGAVEIVCKAYARVKFVEVQRWGAGVYNFSTMRAHLDQGAELTAGLIGLGSRLTKTKLDVSLDGDGARAELLGLSFGDGKQHFDYSTLQDHIAPRTASDLLFKAALAGEASEVWYGTVRIQKGASASEANQTSRNLLLSDHAKAAPIPVLEIEAYDVLRCSHGATAGPLDEDQLFYLESRGIPRDEAARLLISAFFQQVLDRVPTGEGVRGRVEQALAAKIEGNRL